MNASSLTNNYFHLEAILNLHSSYSDGVEYSTSEYEYRKKLRVRVLILKNVLEYEYRKNVRVRVLLQVKQKNF